MIFSLASFVVAPKSRIQLEELAESYLGTMYPGNLLKPVALDVLDMLDQLEYYYDVGFRVAYLPVGDEGRTDPERREIIIDNAVYRAAESGNRRARQTCTHEIGHIDHIDQVNRVIRDGEPKLARHLNKRVEVFRDPEWQARGVGAALLMPRATTPRVFHDGGVAAVAEVFQVSWQSAQVRIEILRKLGVL